MNYSSIVEVNRVILTPSMSCNMLVQPNTMEGKLSEVNYVSNALLANCYPPAVISNVLKKKKPSPELIPSPEEFVGIFFNLIENKSTATARLPYFRGITEPLACLLRKNRINVVATRIPFP